MKTKQSIFIVILILAQLASCKQERTYEIRDEFKKYYDKYEVTGSFALYDQQKDKYLIYNYEQFRQEFIPASTFKICNSLIGLETGVITDENFVIEWDSVPRQIQKWNGDQNLKSAFKNSTVWYYQELARLVGEEQMKYFLQKANYGNTDISGGIDKFWLTGGLRISPEQQIDFLRRFHNNQLPFSIRSVDIVKNIMIAKDSLNYLVRAKSGWGEQNNVEIGWYVGYLETNDNVYYFANCIQSPDSTNQRFAKARIEITYSILDELKLTEK